jgi:hypothetical protein
MRACRDHHGAGAARRIAQGSASPADIAPTLAAIVGIKMPQADGRVLTTPRATQ